MQHRYVPDLGDFSKFALIDVLSGCGDLRTALIWYLVDPHEVGDHRNNDGKHTAYLVDDRQGYAACHPELYRRFQAIHRRGKKHVGIYEEQAVLPNLSYFAEPLSYEGVALKQRGDWRMSWLERATKAVRQADFVVLDPDNGLMPERLSIRSKSAIKYAALDECAAFYAGGERTLVVYQHAHRQGSAAQQADRALTRLASHLGIARSEVFALRFHRGTTRFYLVLPSKRHGKYTRDAAGQLVSSEWGRRGHFSIIH